MASLPETYNFTAQSNGGVNLYIGGDYQYTILRVASIKFIPNASTVDQFIIQDILGVEYTFRFPNDYEIEGVAQTGTNAEITALIADLFS